MAFCYHCGTPLQRGIPAGDTHERQQCPACNFIHYDNPRLLVGCFLYCEDALFWIKRATEPMRGLWSFPTGFVECGETLREAATRELYEETLIRIEPSEMLLMSVVSIRAMDQIYVAFRCPTQRRLESAITQETAASGWFSEAQAPWDMMAYPDQTPQIRQIYHWIQSGSFSIRVGEVSPSGGTFQHFGLK